MSISTLIFFHLNSLAATSNILDSILNYAKFNIQLLNNKSIICFSSTNNFNFNIFINAFNKSHNINLPFIQYSNFESLNSIINSDYPSSNKIFYNLISGELTPNYQKIKNVKNVNHCLNTYNKDNIHGDIYISSSPLIINENIRSLIPYIPFISLSPSFSLNNNKNSLEETMSLFNKYIINFTNSIYNYIDILELDFYTFSFLKDNINTFSNNLNSSSNIYNILTFLLNPGDTFIDINSSFGYYSISLSKYIGNNGRIISIEPNNNIYPLLKSNIESNNIFNISSLNIGLSSSESIKFFNNTEIVFHELDYIFHDHSKINVININSKDIKSSSEDIKFSNFNLDIIKGGILSISKHRPHIILNNYNNNNIKNLFYSLKYFMIDINDNNYLCVPLEKLESINQLFNNYINRITNNSIIVTTPKPLSLKKRIKLMCSWTNGQELLNIWDKMKPPNLNYEFVYNDNNIDYYVIINAPLIEDFYIPEKTIVFRMEPDTINEDPNYIWNQWFTKNNKSKFDFLYFLDLNIYRNNCEWHINQSFNTLLNSSSFPKSKTLSSVVSSLYESEGHIKRINFLQFINDKIDIDIYGRDNLFNFKNHKGELPYHNKDEGIIPYKYTFIAENTCLNNYFTEKITDAILGETLCFYYGCPNISTFLDERAFIKLDLNNFSDSLNIIKNSIENDEWSKRLPFILKEKRKILEQYNFFYRVEGLIDISTLESNVICKNNDQWCNFVEEANKQNFIEHKHYKQYISTTADPIDLWTETKTKNKNMIILDDKLKLTNNFNDKLTILYNKIKNIDFDIVFLGENNPSDNDIKSSDNDIKSSDNDIKLIVKNLNNSNNPNDYIGYIISPNGASKLLNLLKDEIFEFQLIDYFKTLNIYWSIAPLVYL